MLNNSILIKWELLRNFRAAKAVAGARGHQAMHMHAKFIRQSPPLRHPGPNWALKLPLRHWLLL